jgi:hypothetical protein
MKLTIETKFETKTIEFKNSDVSLEQLFDAFKGLLVASTWSEQTINDFIIELAEELKL